MKIAMDAMGGDHAPAEIVKGAAKASEDKDLEIILIGDEEKIRKYLPEGSKNISIRHTDEYIEMQESPSSALRKKPRASIIVGAEMLKSKEADALISAGNTGAFLEAVVLHAGRIKSGATKIKRPAISVVLPAFRKPTVLLDAGANPECKPEYMLQFAKMGCTYAKNILNVKNPTVGLVNIGSEDNKGSTFIKATYDLLSSSGLNFTGNAEPGDIMNGTVDVAVADGFTGNIILKTAEATGELVTSLIKKHVSSSLPAKLGALLMKGVFKKIKKDMDHSEHGGALLFGIDGICIKAHGRAKRDAVWNAINVAKRMIKRDIIRKFAEDLSEGADRNGSNSDE